MDSYGSPWNTMEFHGGPWPLSWNSMEFHGPRHGVHGPPWGSMDHAPRLFPWTSRELTNIVTDPVIEQAHFRNTYTSCVYRNHCNQQTAAQILLNPSLLTVVLPGLKAIGMMTATSVRGTRTNRKLHSQQVHQYSAPL